MCSVDIMEATINISYDIVVRRSVTIDCKDDEITEKYLTLMATCVKLTVENFVLNLKLEGKQ